MNSNSQLTMPFLLRVRHVWVHGFLIGLILGALGFGSYYFLTSFSSFSPSEEHTSYPLGKIDSEQMLHQVPRVSPEMVPEVPKVPPQLPTHPDASINQEMAQILEKIREATLKKDLAGLMNLYSSSFPSLSKKTKSIIRSWKLYNYQKMDFRLHEIKYSAENSVAAWVTWDVAVKDLSTGKTKNISKTYQVSFIKESGQWHIMGLKNAYW
jgi:hypothetical protein